jgi:hypothetical protein
LHSTQIVGVEIWGHYAEAKSHAYLAEGSTMAFARAGDDQSAETGGQGKSGVTAGQVNAELLPTDCTGPPLNAVACTPYQDFLTL